MTSERRRAGRFRPVLLSALLARVLFLPSGGVSTLNADPQESASLERTGTAEAGRVDHPPRMDGTLDDPLWQSPKPVNDFRQREPHEGELPTEKTEVRSLYTRHAVYFGVHCYDSEPSRIIASELRRDVSQDLDDHFEILIDSNHNRRGAYVFEVSPEDSLSSSHTAWRGMTGRPDRTRDFLSPADWTLSMASAQTWC